MNIPEEIIDAMSEYERYILMNEHFPMYKYVLQDIKDGMKGILTDHYWNKQYCIEIDDDYFQKFTWKHGWIKQPLEGALTYIGKKKMICSKQILGVINYFPYNCQQYYQTKFNDWQKPIYQEADFLIISIFIVNYSYLTKIMYLQMEL